MSYSQKRVSYTPQPRQDFPGNSGDPNVRVAVAREGETRDEALGNAKEAIEAYLEANAEQLKQRTRGEKVVVIVEFASPLVA